MNLHHIGPASIREPRGPAVAACLHLWGGAAAGWNPQSSVVTLAAAVYNLSSGMNLATGFLVTNIAGAAGLHRVVDTNLWNPSVGGLLAQPYASKVDQLPAHQLAAIWSASRVQGATENDVVPLTVSKGGGLRTRNALPSISDPDVNVQNKAQTAGNATLLQANAGGVLAFSAWGSNTTAAPAYLCIIDKATAIANGDTPVVSVLFPAGVAGVIGPDYLGADGLFLSAGFGVCWSTTATTVTLPAAGTLHIGGRWTRF